MGVKAAEILLISPILFGACRSVGTVQLPWPSAPPSPCSSVSAKTAHWHHPAPAFSIVHLNRENGVIDDDPLNRLAATNRLHGNSGLEFGTVAAALAHE